MVDAGVATEVHRCTGVGKLLRTALGNRHIDVLIELTAADEDLRTGQIRNRQAIRFRIADQPASEGRHPRDLTRSTGHVLECETGPLGEANEQDLL